MSKILLIGFDGLNSPTKKIINELNMEINTLLLKNNLISIKNQIEKHLKSNTYEYVIVIGQKKGSKGATLERFALNTDQKNKCLVQTGDAAYISSLPLDYLYDLLKNENISVRYSNYAGNKYCNSAFYNVMYWISINQLKTKAGLIHIPSIDKNHSLCFLKKIVEKILCNVR
jgi:pyroglutamyl-peptidase